MSPMKTGLLVAGLLIAGLAQTANAAESSDILAQVIASRSEEDRARDAARHPAQTLALFRVEPGMSVVEALPGGGWYTRILAPYLAGNGALYGVNYNDSMWPRFSFASEQWVADRIAQHAQFPDQVREYAGSDISTGSFTFDTVPPALAGSVDRVLLIRALHNLNRFESQAGTRTQALAKVHSMLAEDGLVGVVQHRAPESASDEWANGSSGYLKQSAVIKLFEQAGFALLASSEINANPKDQPGAEDFVWRLPPSLRGSKNDPQLGAAMLSIGESDRMTLLFRKAR